MNRFKNVLLVTMTVALVALAIGQYRVAADANENVYVVNSKDMPVPVVQVTKWEYRVDSCTGQNPNCFGFTLAGQQGWELVTVSRGPERGTLFTWDFVFKRPRL